MFTNKNDIKKQKNFVIFVNDEENNNEKNDNDENNNDNIQKQLSYY